MEVDVEQLKDFWSSKTWPEKIERQSIFVHNRPQPTQNSKECIRNHTRCWKLLTDKDVGMQINVTTSKLEQNHFFVKTTVRTVVESQGEKKYAKFFLKLKFQTWMTFFCVTQKEKFWRKCWLLIAQAIKINGYQKSALYNSCTKWETILI